MLKYTLKRLILAIVNLFVIIVISFVVVKMVEVEMQTKILDNLLANPTGENRKVYEALVRMGYGKPIMEQLFAYLGGLFRGDFGLTTSLAPKYTPVGPMFFERMAPSMIISFFTTIIAMPIGLTIGVFAALKKNKWPDHTVSTLIMITASVPLFVFAYIFRELLTGPNKLFPTFMPPLADVGGNWFAPEILRSLILPILILALPSIASGARSYRAELCDQLTSEYMLLVRVKGLSKREATVKHALKNALVPFLPWMFLSLISNFGGSLVIERMFRIGGVGDLSLRAISASDYNAFMFTLIFYTALGLFFSIIGELLYTLVDPRMRIGGKK